MIYIALSCLQGRPATDAARDLLLLGADGLQLTPGCVPMVDFRDALGKTPQRTHHGFSWHAYRRPVWDGTRCLVHADSVHPPKVSEVSGALFWQAAEEGTFAELCLETMYPGYHLGTQEDLLLAMALGLRLAVDVSHIFMQRVQGVCSDATWRLLQRYERVAEIHVSDNDGKSDLHRGISSQSFGVDWAKERARDGIPLVLECYMHRLSIEERRRQFELLAT